MLNDNNTWSGTNTFTGPVNFVNSLIVGTSTVTGSCTNGYNLFNNSGILGCQANGGGGGSGVSYANHAALISATTTYGGNNIISQNGFSVSGDGGAATYYWNPNSFCANGTSGSPVTADGIACILPSAQSASTAGRYLIQVGEAINARSFGFTPNGSDNYPYIAGLMTALGPANTFSTGYKVFFTPNLLASYTGYYFSKSFALSTGVNLFCGSGTIGDNSINFIFAAGVDGVIQENGVYTSSGGSGNGTVEGCGIYSQGLVRDAIATPNSATITGASFQDGDLSLQAPRASWSIGDGLIVFGTSAIAQPTSVQPAVSPGAYVGNVTGGTTLTLGGSYVVNPQFSSAQADFIGAISGINFTVGDVFVVGNSTYTFVNSIGSSPGNVLLGQNYISSAANLATCINTNTTSATCVQQSSAPNITLDAPFDRYLHFWAAAGGTGGNSLTSTYTPAGTSAGTFAGGTFANGYADNYVSIWQLPVSQAFTAQTLSGSSQVLITAGPRYLEPGEVIDMDAFPWWTTILTVQGTSVFTQNASNNFNNGDTITITAPAYSTQTFNLVTSLGSAPGNVLIGANFTASVENLAAAMNRGAGSGSTYIAPSGAQNTSACGGGLTCTHGTSTASTLQVLGIEIGPFNGSTTTVSYTATSASAGSFGTPALTLQTLTMDTAFLNSGGQTASKTESAGTMWVVPAGLKRDVQTITSKLSFGNWPIGLQMSCEGVFLNEMNCTGSSDRDNFYLSNIVGIWHSGNNYSQSGSVNENGAKNALADLVDVGALGMSYFNFGSQSGESGTSTANVLMNCINQNGTFFIGGYWGGSSYPTCAANPGLLPATANSGPLYIGPQNLTPVGGVVIAGETLFGSWRVFSGLNNQDCLLLGAQSSASTPLFGFGNAQCTNSNFTWNLGPNSVLGGDTFDLNLGIGSPFSVERFVNGSSGYNGGNVALVAPSGLGLWNYENFSTSGNNWRDLCISAAAPTGTWHLYGDVCFNSTPTPGENALWTDTPMFTTTLGGAVTKGTTTTVTVGACPSVSLTNTTLIEDTTAAPHVILGKYSSCTSTTLTFTAAALNSGANSDAIAFDQWLPAGVIQDNTPVISSCGSSPTIGSGSTNIGGNFVLGTSTPSACTITFAHPYPNHAFCTITPDSSGGAAISGGYYISAISNSAFTLTIGTGTNSLGFTYTCVGD